MAYKWLSTRFPGVRFREHFSRRHGIKKDVYFTIRYQAGGERKEEPCGWSSEGWTAEKAALALAELKNAHRTGEGIDRLSKKREQSAAKQQADETESKRQDATLRKVWFEYVESRKVKWSARHYADHIRAVQPGGEKTKRGKGTTTAGALAPLMGLKLSELTPERIKAWVAKEAPKRGTQTRIAFDALRAFINWCDDQPEYKGLASMDACSRRIKRENLPKKGSKDDCLQREQLPAWFSAIRGLSNPFISAYLQGLLLTGARRNELAGLTWDDIDFKWNAITIHDKVEGLRTIPSTPYVASLLSPLPRRNQWVFSSPAAASGRLQEPRIPHNKALSVAGIEGLTLHGLRRSFGTLSEWIEVPTGVVAQIMGHKPSATAEKHYRRRPLDLLRMWHVKIEAWILDQAGIDIPKEDRKVIQIIKGN
jgi:integrase